MHCAMRLFESTICTEFLCAKIAKLSSSADGQNLPGCSFHHTLFHCKSAFSSFPLVFSGRVHTIYP